MIRLKAVTRHLHLQPYQHSPKSLIRLSQLQTSTQLRTLSIQTSPTNLSKTKFSRKKYVELNSENTARSLEEKRKNDMDGVIRVIDEKLYGHNAHQIDIKASQHPAAKYETDPEKVLKHVLMEPMQQHWASGSVGRLNKTIYLQKEINKLKFKRFWVKNFRTYNPRNLVPNLKEPYRSYAELSRIDKPVGTWLLFYPCAFSIVMAESDILTTASVLGLHLFGAFMMRGAGCIVNDMWDKDIDKHVKRTRNRPLASGRLTTSQAKKSLAVHLAASLAVIPLLPHPAMSLGLAAASLPLVMAYPLAKRHTNIPQYVLGLTFNWGAVFGYAAMTGYVDPMICGPLYAGCVLWTLFYDTIYAFQDREDDAMLGVKSMALLMVGPPNKRLMTLPVAERSRELIRQNRQTRNILMIMLMMSQMGFVIAALNAGIHPIMACFMPMALLCNRLLVFYKEFHTDRPDACWGLFEQERYWMFWLLMCLWPGALFFNWLEDMHNKSMKNYSGGSMSYAAQDHHIYRVDKRVRLEDHRISKAGDLASPDAKFGGAEFR
jgi:4-hydroxybenzoate polyprenyltransferase